MGQFTIELQSGEKAAIRYGNSYRLSFHILNLLKGKIIHREEKILYIISLDSAASAKREYRLLRSKKGVWMGEDFKNGRIPMDDELLMALQKAIGKEIHPAK
jgi:hypothetical protein